MIDKFLVALLVAAPLAQGQTSSSDDEPQRVGPTEAPSIEGPAPIEKAEDQIEAISPALPDESSTSTIEDDKSTGEAEESDPWSKSLSASYFTDLEGANPLKSYSGGIGYRYNEKLSLRLGQSVTHYAYVYANQDELRLGDTVISGSYGLGKYYGLNHSVSLAMDLPISETSRDNEKYTTLSLSLGSSHSPFETDKITLSYGINIKAHLNKYQSTVSGDGRGGSAQPIMTSGWSHSGSYRHSQHLNFSYSFSNWRVRYYDLSPEESVSVDSLPQDMYSASIGLSYTKDFLTVSTGFSKGNVVDLRDSLALEILYRDSTSWYISLSFSI